MIILGDSFSGKTSLVRALTHEYSPENRYLRTRPGTSAVDIYSYHVSGNDISFSTRKHDESLRVWVLGSNKFYFSLHQSLIKKDTLTLMVIDARRTTRITGAIKYWHEICQQLGLTKIITVFNKADHENITDRDMEIISNTPNSYFVSTGYNNEQLQLLRTEIASRVSESMEVPNFEAELLIKGLKIMTQLDIYGTSQLCRIADTFHISYEDLKHGIFRPDVFHELLEKYSNFLMTDLPFQDLTAEGNCVMCSRKNNFVEEFVGQCKEFKHGNPVCDEDVVLWQFAQVDVRENINWILNELIQRNILLPVDDAREGYILPHLGRT